jgi:hypothetical protein
MYRIVLPIALVAEIAGCSQILGLEPATERIPDAVAPPSDTAIDTPPPNDCTTYCNSITANCSGVNAQFTGTSAADLSHCIVTCAKFDPSAAMAGATLGCRIYHANNARVSSLPNVHCPNAGPAGDQVAGPGVCGDPCTNFCSLEIAACGLKGATSNGQYASVSECMTACAGFDKTHKYTINATTFPSVGPGGDSLACRLYHTTNALLPGNATTHCPHTQATPIGPCLGPPTP